MINSNFVGSLLGTSIAGLVTFFAMKREIEFQKNSKRKSEIVGFLKFNNILEGYLNEVEFCIKSIFDLINSNNFDLESVARIQMITDSIDKSLDNIQSLPDEKVMIEIHLAYRVLITEIKAFNSGAKHLMNVNSNEKRKTLEKLKELNGKINLIVHTINEFSNNQENELKKLNK